MTNRIKTFFVALKETLPLLTRHPGQVRYIPEWWSSMNPGRNPLADERPWFAFGATLFLERVIRKDMMVYEYGSGGSTLFFAQRAQKVLSTEHDRDWHSKVLETINRKRLLNCELRLLEPEPTAADQAGDPADPDAYSSNDGKYRGMSFKNYAADIDNYPDGFFDIVSIDGRSRPSCFKHAVGKLKERGYLILDNAEAPYYSSIHNALNTEGWKKLDFIGLFPHLFHFSETCIWQKMNGKGDTIYGKPGGKLE